MVSSLAVLLKVNEPVWICWSCPFEENSNEPVCISDQPPGELNVKDPVCICWSCPCEVNDTVPDCTSRLEPDDVNVKVPDCNV
jgi:hypothetical protein